jgi:hypothetical protein
MSTFITVSALIFFGGIALVAILAMLDGIAAWVRTRR